MENLQSNIDAYLTELQKGRIQKAYRGIIAFMSGLKNNLEKTFPDFYTGTLYQGYMDMTYFPFTPPALKHRKLKIAIVYLHETGKFEAWLGGINRKVQADTITQLMDQDIGTYRLSEVLPGVDSIIETTLVNHPDFDQPEKMTSTIEEKLIDFINDVLEILN